MSYSNPGAETPRHLNSVERDAAEMVTDFSRVLVVGKSQITRVVVSKIVERSGLKPISDRRRWRRGCCAPLSPAPSWLTAEPITWIAKR